MSPTVTRDACAKVNLSLRVTGRRGDGYHTLQSLVAFSGVADRLRFQPAPELTLEIEGAFAGALPASQDNLVLRAAKALRAHCSIDKGAAITLEKRLPLAAGIGGGSADAAAALHGLAALWGLGLLEDELAAIALPLGADLPVCLLGRAAMVTGIGEEIFPLADLPAAHLVLVNPGIGLSTPAVFAARKGPFSSPLAAPARGLSLAALVDWMSEAGNDLQDAAIGLCPAIVEVLRRLRGTDGCLLAAMSGSGATCFGLYDEAEAAQAAASALRIEMPGWWSQAAALLARAGGKQTEQ